eukprot:Gb_11657 [translate_table: standard]
MHLVSDSKTVDSDKLLGIRAFGYVIKDTAVVETRTSDLCIQSCFKKNPVLWLARKSIPTGGSRTLIFQVHQSICPVIMVDLCSESYTALEP